MPEPLLFRLTAVLLLAVCFSPASAQTHGDSKSIRDGVYTAVQAERGAELSKDMCANCHPNDWFTGTFLKSWSGARLDALYELIRTTMPQDRPGALTREQYADILAYVFELNGVPPGEQELSAKKETLASIIIDWKQ